MEEYFDMGHALDYITEEMTELLDVEIFVGGEFRNSMVFSLESLKTIGNVVNEMRETEMVRAYLSAGYQEISLTTRDNRVVTLDQVLNDVKSGEKVELVWNSRDWDFKIKKAPTKIDPARGDGLGRNRYPSAPQPPALAMDQPTFARYYNFNHLYRGNVIIYQTSVFDRKSIPNFFRADMNKVKGQAIKMFKSLGFSEEEMFILPEDLTTSAAQIAMAKIKNGTLRDGEKIMKPFKECDCIAMYIGTHGLRDNRLLTRNGEINLFEDILYPLHYIPGLVGKPKLIFVDACQGHGIISGLKVFERFNRHNFNPDVPEGDTQTTDSQISATINPPGSSAPYYRAAISHLNPNQAVSLPLRSDYFILRSSPYNFATTTYRGGEQDVGSPMFYVLNKEIEAAGEMLQYVPLTELVTGANCRLAPMVFYGNFDRSDCKQFKESLETTSSLRHILKLPPKDDDTDEEMKGDDRKNLPNINCSIIRLPYPDEKSQRCGCTNGCSDEKCPCYWNKEQCAERVYPMGREHRPKRKCNCERCKNTKL